MIFYKCFRVVFYSLNILTICILIMTNNIEAYEQVYTDVIKNISLANKIIQSLVKNYEYFQNIHTSEESSSSSIEINASHNIVSSYKQIKQRNRTYNKTQKAYTTTLRPGTAIIYETESSRQEITDTEEEDESVTEKHIIVVTNNKENIQNKQIEKENSEEYKESDDIEAITLDMPPKNEVGIFKPNKKITITDINTNNRENGLKHNGHGKKTRFSVLRLVPKNKRHRHNKLKIPLKSDTRRRVKKVVHSEIFSPNKIWREIVHKPIKLKRDRDPFLKINKRPNFKSKSNEIIAIVILDKNVKESVVYGSNSDRNSKTTTRSQLDNMLRETYGEVCLQVPIKKCNKALKAVNKNVCKTRFKCKSDFKSDFIDNGKTGCKKKFSFTKANNTNKNKGNDNKETIQPLLLRSQNNNDAVESSRHKIREFAEGQRSVAMDDISETLHIPTLRDKYEKQCQKVLREKCIDACNYAVEETCASHSCVSRKKKAFKKACKEECKNIFRVEKDSSDDSDDDDSDSDSDSGNDSDSGSD